MIYLLEYMVPVILLLAILISAILRIEGARRSNDEKTPRNQDSNLEVGLCVFELAIKLLAVFLRSQKVIKVFGIIFTACHNHL